MQGDIVTALGVGLSILGTPQTAPTTTPAELLSPGTSVVTELRAGTGRSIQPGDLVTVHFQVATADGRELANTHKRGMPYSIEFRLTDPFWATLLTGMKAGGERKLTLSSDLYFGENGVPGLVPSSTTLLATVEVVSTTPNTKPDAQTVAIKNPK